MNPIRTFITRNRKTVGIASTLIVLSLLVWMLVLRPKNTIASLVPDHASWYLEVDRPMEVLKGVTRGVRLFADPSLTLFAEWQKELGYVKELFKAEPKISDYFQTNTIGISAHVLAGKEAGYLFYMPLPHAEHDPIFAKLKRIYGHSPRYKYTERQYMNRRIAEIVFKKGQPVSFTLSSSQDALVGSFSGFLVEEVVRKSGLLFKPNFAENLKRDARYAGIAGKPVRLFVNLSHISDFLYQYLNQNLNGLRLGAGFGESLVLGFEAPKNTSWTSQGYLLQHERKQLTYNQPLDPKIRQYLPASSAQDLHWSLPQIWNTLPGKSGRDINTPDTLNKALDQQMLLANLEGQGLKKYEKLLITRVLNPKPLESWLQINSRPVLPNESLFQEKVGAAVIRQHSNPGLGRLLGGKVLADWVPLFYCHDDPFLLISDDVETIKLALDRKRSRAETADLTVQPRFLNWQIQPSTCLPLLMDGAVGIFKQNISQWITLVRSIASVSLKDDGEEENPAITFTIEFKIPSTTLSQWEESEKVFLDSNATSGPMRMEWLEGDQHFWAVQDVKRQASVFGPNLEKQFTFSMGSALVSHPMLLESGNARSFSMLFPTAGTLHVLNNQGKEVPHFPLFLPDSGVGIEHARAIDYDHSHQYRIATTNRYGSVYIADLQGRFLHGWNPWPYDVPMQMAPKHIRIGEKDVMLMLDRNGKLMMTNRKSEPMPGFPVQLHGRTDQPIFVEQGLSFKDSYVYVLSDLGQVEKINFEGVTTSGLQLFRPDKNTRFQFCMDSREKTFSIARISGNYIAVFDQSYKQVFDVTTKTDQVLVQYFHFGASNKIFAVIDQASSECHLFDEAGQKLSPNPIETDQTIDIIREDTQNHRFVLVKCFKNKLSKIVFEKE